MEHTILNTLTHIGLKLSKELLLMSEKKSTNTVFSPLSIHAMLGLIGSGSKGSSQDQILSFLKLKSKDELGSFAYELSSYLGDDKSFHDGLRLLFVNGVWIDKSLTLKPSFEKVVDTLYQAACSQVDFRNDAEAVRDEVNSWTKTKTNGLIEEILPSGSVTGKTRLIMANALHFKGTWLNKFNPLKTREHNFHLLSGNQVKVPFMTSKEDQIVGCFKGFKVLKLPYENNHHKRRFSMYIFLPNARNGLRVLVDKLCSESGFLDRHLPRKHVEVHKFLIPSFKVSLRFEASEILKGLGLKTPLACAEMVDSPDENLFVEGIYHQSFIQVNEQGTEAAAATAIAIYGCGVLADPSGVDFVADHPFLFLIRDDATGTVLFVGHLLNPLI